jgi:hypothetical protein
MLKIVLIHLKKLDLLLMEGVIRNFDLKIILDITNIHD